MGRDEYAYGALRRAGLPVRQARPVQAEAGRRGSGTSPRDGLGYHGYGALTDLIVGFYVLSYVTGLKGRSLGVILGL